MRSGARGHKILTGCGGSVSSLSEAWVYFTLLYFEAVATILCIVPPSRSPLVSQVFLFGRFLCAASFSLQRCWLIVEAIQVEAWPSKSPLRPLLAVARRSTG
jgi:hypothetical protein